MNAQNQLNIKYSPVFAIFLLLCSVIILYVTLLVGPSVTTITGVISLLLGVLMLTRPITRIYADRVESFNLLGMLVKTHDFKSNPPLIDRGSLRVGGVKLTPQWITNTSINSVRDFLAAKGAIAAAP
jgi:hypothetical protein